MGAGESGCWSKSSENNDLPNSCLGDLLTRSTCYLNLHAIEHLASVGLVEKRDLVKFQSGNCDGLVNPMHITASVFINDDESGLHQDYDKWLERLAPHDPISQYLHNRTGEDNADAHLKRQVLGREVVVAVTDGKLDFGTWEQIFYAEFDGRRTKRVLIKIIGE
jgi:secondary thiamine-phosphate synthase enzyme